MATNPSETGVTVDEEHGDSLTRETIIEALTPVTDPELDRSIVELEYVDETNVEYGEDGASVHVAFTLPTAWCSPAFAWMMATDARDAVEGLTGVAECVIELREHMHTDEVNAGINERRSFEEAFPEAEDGIADLRATLDEKARLARQYDAVEELLAAGLTGPQVTTLRRDDIERLPEGDRTAVYVRDQCLALTVPTTPLERYRQKAIEVDLFDDDSPRLFRTPEGDPIDADEFDLVHRRARLARVNMDGQGGVCDALHEARRDAPGGD